MNLNVVFLGCTQGYGYNFSACNTKVEFMARGLSELGDICYIHNGPNGKIGLVSPQYRKMGGIGTIIDYPTKINWYVSPFFNYFLLVQDLKRWKQSNGHNIVILEAPYLPFYYLEVLAARQVGYKIVVISHEWLGTFQCSNKIRRWILHRYSEIFGYCVDAILPISEYIIQRIKKFDKPYLKIPVLADFSHSPVLKVYELFFLYCVSAEYLRVIEVVITGFKLFYKQFPNYKLLLVLSGSQNAIASVFSYIDQMELTHIVEIKYKLPYNELKSLYSKASGLIVALNPDFEQDKARFSQKIAEYLSSGSVLISNNVGEIGYYFQNKKNIILDEYSSQGYYNSFRWIAEHPQEAQCIGRAGYELGKKFFDYKICGKQLHDFLSML
jgi:glycosyltransferase involved in cell wall biosynthesis